MRGIGSILDSIGMAALGPPIYVGNYLGLLDKVFRNAAPDINDPGFSGTSDNPCNLIYIGELVDVYLVPSRLAMRRPIPIEESPRAGINIGTCASRHSLSPTSLRLVLTIHSPHF